MKLGALLTEAGITALPPDGLDKDVLAIVQDSRSVKSGSLFVAVQGFHADGHQFIPQAVQQGAVAVIAEEKRGASISADTPLIQVPDSRTALAFLADAFYGHPSQRLKLIGITGTNGKTTTNYLVQSMLSAGGFAAGLIGTIHHRVGDNIYPALNTTPESLELQQLLAEMVERGFGHCVMEVSSHALALGRTAACVFSVGAFTNLTQDHLDFHRTMEEYFQAKRSLFAGLGPDNHAVVNLDDPYAREIINATKATVTTTGLSAGADIHPRGTIAHDMDGLSFVVKTLSGTIDVESPLVGAHNVFNILTAVGIGTVLGLPNSAIALGIKNLQAIPGRMEKVDEGQPFGVIVDYAHTEDAIMRLLGSVREVAAGRIIMVFGCGGDRDRTKRPLMGAAAVEGSDIVIVTSDNPRTEDPLVVIGEIAAGMEKIGFRMAENKKASPSSFPLEKTPYFIVPDRREAIQRAITMAMPGDVVVIAGKGHEDYQIIGETKNHFDDREEARRAIRTMEKIYEI